MYRLTPALILMGALTLAAAPLVGSKITVGSGSDPFLDINKTNGDIHVVYEHNGSVMHAVYGIDGTEKEAAAVVPGSNIHAGSGSGHTAVGVTSDGDPIVIVNENVFANQDLVRAWAVARDGDSWSIPQEIARAEAPQETGKSNRPWLPAAEGDTEGNVHIFLTNWTDNGVQDRYYVKMTTSTITSAQRISWDTRLEGFNDIAVDSDNNPHFVWANSSSGTYYQTIDAFGSVQESEDFSGGGFTAGVDVEDDGTVHCVYNSKHSTLSYCTVEGGNEQNTRSIDDDAMKGAVAVDTTGTVYVVYYSMYWGDEGAGDKTIYLSTKSPSGTWTDRIDLGPADELTDRSTLCIKSWKNCAVIAGHHWGNVFIRIMRVGDQPVGIAPGKRQPVRSHPTAKNHSRSFTLTGQRVPAAGPRAITPTVGGPESKFRTENLSHPCHHQE